MNELSLPNNLPPLHQLIECYLPTANEHQKIRLEEETMGEFNGKVVIVTGGAKGIGRGISLSFAREGANVLAADIDVKAGQQISEAGKDLLTEYFFH